MKKILFPLFLLLACAFARAQGDHDLSGLVRDSLSGKPLAGTSVFLNGTSKGTVTQANGSFLLRDLPKGRYELVISAIGYETFVLEISSTHLPPPLKITLSRKATELTAFTVEPYLKDGWQRWGKFFVDNFIGTIPNAASCRIMNRDVLRFHFYKKSNRLTVTATEPVLIANSALGYTIQFKLEEFACDFSSNIVRYFGYPFFMEMTTKREGRRRRWIAARQVAYQGSVAHFMRSLYSDRCKEEFFIMQLDVRYPNLEKRRVKAIYRPDVQPSDTFSIDTLHHFWEVLRQPDFFIGRPQVGADSLVTIYPDNTKSIFWEEQLQVIFGNPRKGIEYRESQVRMVTPAMVIIQENGAYYPPQELLMSGVWAHTEKIANLLPIEYGMGP